jgi:hypothetical protein
MRIRRLITIVALVITASATTTLSASAAQASPRAASPWFKVWLRAGSGGGCATFASDQRLAPIISEPCTSTNWWWYRDISQSVPFSVGDNLEFVDQNKTFALGFSGGLFKLETPSDSSTYLVVDLTESTSDLALLINQAGTGFMAPNGRGLDVKVLANATFPDDGWAPCINATGICN